MPNATLYSSDNSEKTQTELEWVRHASQLAGWAFDNLYSRHDTFPEWNKAERGWRRRSLRIDRFKLRQHFEGSCTVGSYPMGLDKQSKDIDCDIDAHDDQPYDPIANLEYAQQIYHELLDLGANPVLEDTNGQGGYHVRIYFAEPIDGAAAHSIGKWLLRDCPDGVHAESFPADPKNDFGTQIRLPGKHHKKPHWSRFWDGAKWLEGAEACQHLLEWEPTDPNVFPDEAQRFIVATPVSGKPKAAEVGLAHAERIKQARASLVKTPGAVQGKGKGADKYCFGVAMGILHGFQLTEDEAIEVLHEWGQRDDQTDAKGNWYPWTPDQIRHKVEDCAKAEYRGTVGGKLFLDDVAASMVSPLETETTTDKQPTPQPPAKRKRFLKPSEVRQIADTQTEDWLMPNWLEFGSLGMLCGEPFAGKSHLMAELQATIFRDGHFGPHKVQPCCMLVIDLENRENKWTKRLANALGESVDVMDNVLRRWNPDEDELPFNPSSIEGMIKEVKKEMGGEKIFVVIDTLRSAFDESEMDTDEMKRLLYPLQRVAQRTNAAILIIHHRPKNKAFYSGQTAIAGALDFLWVFDSDKETLRGTLSLAGGRDDPDKAMVFELRDGKNYYVPDAQPEQVERLVREALGKGALNQEQLVKAVISRWVGRDDQQPSKPTIRKVIDGMVGNVLVMSKGEKNAKLYTLMGGNDA